MTDDAYDVFISYARTDNVPGPTEERWVSWIQGLLHRDRDSGQADPFKVFFDTSDINIGDRFWDRILQALHHSVVIVPVVSRGYFASKYCRLEWEEFRARKASRLVKEGTAMELPVFLEPVPGIDDPIWKAVSKEQGVSIDRFTAWRESLSAINGAELSQPRRDLSTEDLVPIVERRIRGMAAMIAERIADLPPLLNGNIGRPNPHFIGRTTELDELHRLLTVPSGEGAVTVLHGPGGMGKTELLEQYAVGHRREISDAWVLRARDQKDLAVLAASLADMEEFQLARKHTSSDSASDPSIVGQTVLNELLHRSKSPGARAILVILENISDPELLSERQVSKLPSHHKLRFVATTRLGEGAYSDQSSLQFQEIGPIDSEDGVRIIRGRQGDDRFPGDEQEAAARGIVDRFGSHTLAVERVAVYLGNHPDTSPKMFFAGLRQYGIVPAQEAIGLTLDKTLLEVDAPTSKALTLAALLPVDTIPWSYVERLVGARFPEAMGSIFNPRGGWLTIKRTLSGARLLTETHSSQLARMNRLIGEYLAHSAAEEDFEAVDLLLASRCQAISAEGELESWEPAVLVDALLDRLEDSELELYHRTDRDRFAMSVNVDALISRLSQHVGDDRPIRLARVIAERVESGAEKHPGDRDYESALAVAHTNLGGILRRIDRPESLRYLQEASRSALRLAEAVPGEIPPLDILATSLSALARELGKNDADRALRSGLAALAVRLFVWEEVQDPMTALRLVRAYEEAARLLERSDPSQAIRLNLQALPTAREIVTKHPTNLDIRRALGFVLNDLARMNRDDLEVAKAYSAEALEVSQGNADRWPANFEARRGLAIALDSHAKLLDRQAKAARQSDRSEAIRFARQALEVAERLAEDQPANPEALRGMTFPLNTLGMLLQHSDRHAALSYFTRTMEIAEHLSERNPDDLDAKRGLAIVLLHVARQLIADDQEKAFELVERGLALDEENLRLDPANLKALQGLSYGLSSAIRLYREAGRPCDALRCADRSVGVSVELTVRQPEDAGCRKGLDRARVSAASLREACESHLAESPSVR